MLGGAVQFVVKRLSMVDYRIVLHESTASADEMMQQIEEVLRLQYEGRPARILIVTKPETYTSVSYFKIKNKCSVEVYHVIEL